jgi:DNA invertase Pin-like site-specific DNA recombinase
MSTKITSYHTDRMAYVYLRQSTMGQVLHHQESTERQYALKNRALECGWTTDRVRVLDGDLGISGAYMVNRPDFKTLVADVSLNKVGAIFALEASRLSRSSGDWNRLFDLCSLTDTLIIDEDGIYNPTDFNDQLLLGLKGMMSQAELHFIRARLLGGKLNKAKKGTLRSPLPVGYCYDEEGRIVFDSDQEVSSVVKLVFDAFQQTGSAYAVVQKFGHLNLKFPKRAYGGVWKGKLIWGRLTHERVLGLLKNPAYAGVYVYGRYRYKKTLSTDGSVCVKTVSVPMSSWQVTIKDHHEGYINWDQFLHNCALLQQNQTNGIETMLSTAAREGIGLLQGMLICGICGRRLTIRYQGNGGLYPIYECNWRRRDCLPDACSMMFRCDIADEAIGARILEVLQPAQIALAVKAMEQVEHQNKAIDAQWHMRVQRAEYEASLAQRRYEEVDPANRLVASTLEKRWNEALVALEQVKQQHNEFSQKEHLGMTPEQRDRMFALAQDLPRLWKAPTTQSKDRKRILRLLIKDITVEKALKPKKKLILHVRWQGGATEDISCDLPAKAYERTRYGQEIVQKTRELAKNLFDDQIAEAFNKEGLLSSKGGLFTGSKIRNIRFVHAIPSPPQKRPGESSVKEVAQRFKVSTQVVYYWIERGYVAARRSKYGLPFWISLAKSDDEKLRRRVDESYKLHSKRDSHS